MADRDGALDGCNQSVDDVGGGGDQGEGVTRRGEVGEDCGRENVLGRRMRREIAAVLFPIWTSSPYPIRWNARVWAIKNPLSPTSGDQGVARRVRAWCGLQDLTR